MEELQTPSGTVSRAWVPEALELKGSPIPLDIFYPPTLDKVKLLGYLFEGQLLKAFLAGGNISPAQIQFIDQTVASTSRLIHRQLLFYQPALPRPSVLNDTMRPLPETLKNIQKEAHNLGLAEAIRAHYTRGESWIDEEGLDDVSLSEYQLWVDITAELASGEIRFNSSEELSNLIQDCVSGLVSFLGIIATENGGLQSDDYSRNQLQHLAEAYNTLIERDLLDRNFGAADAAASEIPDLAAAEVDGPVP